MIPPDDRTDELRAKILSREGLDSSVRLILYPVRCVRRKNVEEAIFFTCLLNCLADGNTTKKNCPIEGKFHLLVSLRQDNQQQHLLPDPLNQDQLQVSL